MRPSRVTGFSLRVAAVCATRCCDPGVCFRSSNACCGGPPALYRFARAALLYRAHRSFYSLSPGLPAAVLRAAIGRTTCAPTACAHRRQAYGCGVLRGYGLRAAQRYAQRARRSRDALLRLRTRFRACRRSKESTRGSMLFEGTVTDPARASSSRTRCARQGADLEDDRDARRGFLPRLAHRATSRPSMPSSRSASPSSTAIVTPRPCQVLELARASLVQPGSILMIGRLARGRQRSRRRSAARDPREWLVQRKDLVARERPNVRASSHTVAPSSFMHRPASSACANTPPFSRRQLGFSTVGIARIVSGSSVDDPTPASSSQRGAEGGLQSARRYRLSHSSRQVRVFAFAAPRGVGEELRLRYGNSSTSSSSSSSRSIRALARLGGADQLVELHLDCLGVAVLGVLDQEHHQERHDRRARVDHELPRVAVTEDRAGDRPRSRCIAIAAGEHVWPTAEARGVL